MLDYGRGFMQDVISHTGLRMPASWATQFLRGPRTTLRFALVPLIAIALHCASSSAQTPDATSAGAAADPTQPAELERAFQNVVTRVSPSVVGIRARREQYTASTENTASDASNLVVLNGSGTILRNDGLILTNEHVVQAASAIEVTLHDGRTFSAEIVGTDPRSDLAVLRIDASGLQAAHFCDWNAVARGQWNIAVGNPYGLGKDGQLSISVGVISNLGRRLPGLGEVDDRLYADMIQTTASAHPGNSGGPLFNLRGEMLGIVTAVHTRSVDDSGVAFAIPLSPATRRVIDSLASGRRVRHGYLGVTVRTPTDDERAASGKPNTVGVFVEKVDPDGPAARAGLLPGDLLTQFNDRRLDAPLTLAQLVSQSEIGAPAALHVLRTDGTHVLNAQVGERQTPRVSWLRSGAVTWRGLRLADGGDAIAQSAADGSTQGVVVLDCADHSPAAKARVPIGAMIEAVDDVKVESAAEFLRVVRGRHGNVTLTLDRGRTAVVGP